MHVYLVKNVPKEEAPYRCSRLPDAARLEVLENECPKLDCFKGVWNGSLE